MKSSQILSMSLADAGFSVQTRRKLAKKIYRHLKGDDALLELDHWRQSMDAYAASVTLANLINCIDADLAEHNSRWVRLDNLKVIERLVALGLTKIDWVLLPNQTVTSDMLKGLGKKALRQRSVLLLGTLSPMAIRALVAHFANDVTKITLDDLIAAPVKEWTSAGGGKGDFSASLTKTRQLLRELGFGYKDGPFFQDGTSRQFAGSI